MISKFSNKTKKLYFHVISTERITLKITNKTDLFSSQN